MTDQWVNAVVELTVVLDVPVTASEREKRDALHDAMERLIPDDPDVVAAGRWEDVSDD